MMNYEPEDFARTLKSYLACRDCTPNPVIIAALQMASGETPTTDGSN